jgi:type I restriction-modification system DNA methylase subunit
MANVATTKQQTNESLRSEMWRACDILRRDNNVGGIMQYTEHLAWLLFLKFLDEEEKRRAEEAVLTREMYQAFGYMPEKGIERASGQLQSVGIGGLPLRLPRAMRILSITRIITNEDV